MGAFGWSYPPGCNSVPGDEPCICEVCGKVEDACICPECEHCGSVGDMNCYKPDGCNLTLSQEQLDSIKAEQQRIKEENEALAKFEQEAADFEDYQF